MIVGSIQIIDKGKKAIRASGPSQVSVVNHTIELIRTPLQLMGGVQRGDRRGDAIQIAQGETG